MLKLRNRKNDTLLHDKRDFSSRLKILLGFRPGNLRLYETAFIHRSASYTTDDGTRLNNERLEYLGDSIINSIISEYLFKLYPDTSEGLLTKTRARLVNRETLNNLALSMQLNDLIISNISPSGSSRNLYGNALEALLGALFIDTGYERTRRFIINAILKKHIDLNEVLEGEMDYKSLILEYGQKKRIPVNFNISEETSSDSLKLLFSVNLLINNEVYSTGIGNSKKEAEQDAAFKAWTIIRSAT